MPAGKANMLPVNKVLLKCSSEINGGNLCLLEYYIPEQGGSGLLIDIVRVRKYLYVVRRLPRNAMGAYVRIRKPGLARYC